MPVSLLISSFLAAISFSQLCCGLSTLSQPKPLQSSNSFAYSDPYTKSFLGTQPRKTQVPPTPPAVRDALVAKGSSATATFAPNPVANLDPRTPPLPAPMVNMS